MRFSSLSHGSPTQREKTEPPPASIGTTTSSVLLGAFSSHWQVVLRSRDPRSCRAIFASPPEFFDTYSVSAIRRPLFSPRQQVGHHVRSPVPRTGRKQLGPGGDPTSCPGPGTTRPFDRQRKGHTRATVPGHADASHPLGAASAGCGNCRRERELGFGEPSLRHLVRGLNLSALFAGHVENSLFRTVAHG